MPSVRVETIVYEEEYWRRVTTLASDLRYAILARLTSSPTTLHRLYEDLVSAAEHGLLPEYPTLMDVAELVGLYKRLGLVEEGASGVLYVVAERMPNSVKPILDEWSLKLNILTEKRLIEVTA